MSTTPSYADPRTVHKLLLTNVRVFDGHRLVEPDTVVIDNGLIGTDPGGAEVVDAGGATLLPGLIDAHVHLSDTDALERLADFGVTTALEMANWSAKQVEALRGHRGAADIRSAGTPATASGSMHSGMPGFPDEGLVDSAAAAPRFVTDRVAEGADYIKVIADQPGPDQATLDALVAAAHEHGKQVVAHAVSCATYSMAADAGADFITHAPYDKALDEEFVARLVADHTVVIPTLGMMKGVIEFLTTLPTPPVGDYAAARANIAAIHRAGVPILAGTDSNSTPGVPVMPPPGESLHDELALLVDAGLSPVEALRAATVLPAEHFGLTDRGVIEPGRRADLILLDGDPTTDIHLTRRLLRVWCAGVERVPRTA
ncbi:amidohydrolase family protein [Nocardia sp. NPDC052566]|uniref:amidohydrolase family protein n=1 Tax=Nocardia sp. NPDC052566 TaxID=3364330 RepID=UPI0037C7987D